MSDTAINLVIQYGTNADRIAFTPDPAVGSQILYLWYETDNPPDLYAWDGSAWVQVNAGAGAGITSLTGDVTGTGPGATATTIAANAVTTAKILNANVTLAKIQDFTALAILGRQNSVGAPVLISAGADDRLLVRTGSALSFAQLTVGMIPNALITPTQLSTAAKTKTIGFTFDNGGSPLTNGMLSHIIRIPTGFTVTSWNIMADVAGDIEFDIFADAPGVTYPPTTSIVASAPPELTGGTSDFDDDSTLTGWTTALTALHCLQATIVSTSGTINKVTLQLFGTLP